MSRRGNPYDNAKAESFMKTLKVEAVYLAAYETFEDVTADLPRFIDRGLQYEAVTFRVGLSQPNPVRGSTRPADGQNARLILSTRRGALHSLPHHPASSVSFLVRATTLQVISATLPAFSCIVSIQSPIR